MEIKFVPVAMVKNSRKSLEDDSWGEVFSEIELCDHIPADAFDGISGFSDLEIIYYLDKVDDSEIVFSGHPRGNHSFPVVGIFGQRKKDRPNKIGLCTAQLIEHDGRRITVKNLDAVDGTPVLDIKPVYKEFRITGEIRQPDWVSDLMKHYWK